MPGRDACAFGDADSQASFVIAMIMPISTNTTIAPCSQIQVGDMVDVAYPHRWKGMCRSRAIPSPATVWV